MILTSCHGCHIIYGGDEGGGLGVEGEGEGRLVLLLLLLLLCPYQTTLNPLVL